jgi:hypothetical protein
MEYRKLKVQNLTETDLREKWKEEYCDSLKPIFTFDNILVQFFEDMFEHAFYESYNKKKGDKSILSLNRCQKMLWIKDTLQDTTAILKIGWDKHSKSYIHSRRVALIKNNYIVIIRFLDDRTAKFLTAYEVNDERN